MKMNNHETWKSFINFETKKPYFKKIKDHLISDNAEGKIVLPEPKNFFRAFDLCELNKVKVDTVGPIFPGVEVKLAEDGEILVKGENLMLGYWNNKEATEQTIKDGWLHTGDIGEFDEDNYLKITDRKKDIIVSLGGDNIAPSKIENLLTLSPEIEQACVFGEQKNYIAALLVLNSESKSSDEDIQRYIDEVNKDLTQPEKIKKFIFIDEPFSIENNLMTPTMKVRRHEVQKKYQNQIDQLF